mmetsp:Transcript_28390/g.69103  ORF Transcript_28390/g.69103 Transcript_28390/m.69103 type:complete len:970 (+) Transcript_28390:77-2986(+)
MQDVEQRVQAALVALEKVLHAARRPAFADQVPHTYDDKYMLTEFLTSSAIAATINCLEELGLTPDMIESLCPIVRSGREVTLRLRATERCKHLREVKRDVQSPSKTVTDSTLFGRTERSVVTTITEQFWEFEVDYEILAFEGADADSSTCARAVLCFRKAHCEIMTTTLDQPKPTAHSVPPIDVSLTWLLTHLAEDGQLSFTIDRSQPSCLTPRRNSQIDDAMKAAQLVQGWATRAQNYFRQVFNVVKPTPAAGHKAPDIGVITTKAESVLVPVLPVFAQPQALLEAPASEAPSAEQVAETGLARPTRLGESAAMVSVAELNTMLAEQRRSLGEQQRALAVSFPEAQDDKLFSTAEAKLILVFLHLRDVMFGFSSGVEHIEQMLRNQLVAAIGKEVGPDDFMRYMRHHEARTYLPSFTPQPFCLAVRRPHMYPEGTVTIEVTGGGETDPICTWSRQVEGPPMTFRLSAATTVEFTGERYLHGYIAHRFANESSSGPSLQLTARARQFSSFMLLLGRIGPNHTFQPQHAIVVQNKDDLVIPLLLEQLPTPKEFRDAVESLSPEQRRFAEAYRAMQLEGSVFAVLLVQLKPQLEMLLRLPPKSLTKEIQLTQDLLQLFIQYQIPSDLLSCDEDCPPADKLGAVKSHVQAIFTMINEAKESEIKSAKEEHLFANPQAAFGSAPMPSCSRSSVGNSRGGGGAMMLASAPMPMMEAMCMCDDFSAPPPPPAAACNMAACGMAAPEPTKCRRAKCSAPSFKMKETVSAPPVNAQPGGQPPAKPSQQKPPEKASPAEQPDQAPASEEWQDGGLGTQGGGALDFTQLPAVLDSKYAKHDVDSALRPTKLIVGEEWQRSAQKALLGKPTESTLNQEDQKAEKNKSFDLLDALSRSGSLPLASTALHVVVAATHCFDTSLMDTVIKKNVNPIEKLERSALIMASTIHDVEPQQLIQPSQHTRIATFSAPALLQVAHESE